MKKLNICISAILLAIISVADSCEKKHEADPIYKYSVPEQIDDGWPTASLEDVGIDVKSIERMIDKINSNKDSRIHSIAIVKNGSLVFEEYFEGYEFGHNPPGADGDWMEYTRDTEHFCASVSKSITATLFGIAVDKGLINSVDDKIKDYFPEYSDILAGDKAGITIRHLLTMSSGLPFDENSYPFGNPLNDVTRLFLEDDPIRWILGQPLDYLPGTTYWYNSGTTNVLAAIIEKAAGTNLEIFMDNYLFEPLGIMNEDYLIEVFKNGRFFASGGFYMSSRELCKIGYIYINSGEWKGNKILSQNWIDEATGFQIDLPSYITHSDSYGYQWWRDTFTVKNKKYRYFSALGWGEQVMMVFPDEDLIVQFFCGYYQSSNIKYIHQLIKDYILSSLS